MSGWSAARITDTSARCDESGICDVVEEIGRCGGVELTRLVEARAEWASIVDIAPIALGHLLVLPFEHLQRSSQLGIDRFAKYWDYISEAASTLSVSEWDRVAMVEHGSPSGRHPMSCVRHCHTHVCPVENHFRSVDEMLPVVEKYVDVTAIHSNWQETYVALSRMDEYMLVYLAGSAIVGRPRSGIRQISRALLLALNGQSGIRDADWVLEAENQAYFDTLKLLRK